MPFPFDPAPKPGTKPLVPGRRTRHAAKAGFDPATRLTPAGRDTSRPRATPRTLFPGKLGGR